MPVAIHKVVFGSRRTVVVEEAMEKVVFVGLDPATETPAIWYETTEKESKPRTFDILGTGEWYDPARARHVGSVREREFMWHVMEYIE